MRYHIRDQHGAARAVACLMVVAAAYNLVTGILLKLNTPQVDMIVVTGVMLAQIALGAVCWRRPSLVPRAFWVVVPFFGIAVVTVLNFATSDASAAAQLFYLWPLLFAATYLSRRIAYLNAAAISVGHAPVVFHLMPSSPALIDWISLTVAVTMIAWVVINLNDRNDRLRAVLQEQATTDALTGVANRRAFDQALHQAVGSAESDGTPAALVLIDVDHFKLINDTWGHAAGDSALHAVGDALRSATDGTPHLVARLGGDEFAVLLRCGPREAEWYADRARTMLNTTTGLPGGPPRLSIGIGVAPHHATGPEELQRVADAALYQAKDAGRGRTALAA
jgi:diguanylate cyclase (GGDEF)-like protein